MAAARRRVIRQGTYVVHQDELRGFLTGEGDALFSEPAGNAAAAAGGGGARGLLVSRRIQDDVRRELAKKDGFYKAIVWKPATDVWTGGWEVDATSEQLKEEIQRWEQNVRVWPMMRGMREAGRRCHALARRDGISLLWARLRDASPTLEQAPRNVAEVVELRPVTKQYIKKIHLGTDPKAPRFGMPVLYEIYTVAGEEQSVVKLHWERVVPFIPAPNDDTPGTLEGESELDALINGAEILLNIKWASGAAYYKFGSPYLVANVDKEIEVDEEDEEIKLLDERLANLKSGAEEKIRVHGVEISAVTAGTDIKEPTEFVKIHREDAAAATGIPLRELTGSEAGALQAAQWDSRRYDQSVVTPTRDSFGGSILLEVYPRLQRWGILKAAGQVRGIIWYPYVQVDERERAPQMLQALTAGEKADVLDLPWPKELQALLTIEGVDLNQPRSVRQPNAPPLRPVAAAAPPAPGREGGARERGGRSAEGDARRVGVDAVLDWLPLEALDRLEARAEAALRGAFAAWHDDVSAAVERMTGQPLAVGDADDLRGERSAEALRLALIAIQFDDAELAEVLTLILLEAAQLGLTTQAQRLGREELREFLNTPEAPVLRQHARVYSAEKARRASEAVRDVIATVIGRGGSVRDVELALRHKFRTLENTSTIARTEVMRGYTQGNFAAMRAAGVTHWQFRTFPGADEHCLAFEGNVYPLGTGPAPPLHPNCRCVPDSVLSREVVT